VLASGGASPSIASRITSESRFRQRAESSTIASPSRIILHVVKISY
jgi:hypothetical protein